MRELAFDRHGASEKLDISAHHGEAHARAPSLRPLRAPIEALEYSGLLSERDSDALVLN